MGVRYLNATGTQYNINETKRRLDLKTDKTTTEALQAKVTQVEGSIPTKTSDLENDSSYLTETDTDDKYASKTSVENLSTAVQGVASDVATLNADSETVGSVDYKIAQALGNVSSFRVVSSLPADPSTTTLYFLTESPGVYSIHIYSGGNWLTINDLSALNSAVTTLNNTVGNSTSGLVKAVADLNAAVGDADSGLTKDVADNTTALATINGSDTGSSMRDVAEDVVSSIPKSITPKGTVTFENLPALSDAEIGDMYNVSDDFTTTADFVMGAGVEMNANSNVYVIDAGSGTKKWDVFATQGIADMSAYQTKTLTSHTGITATTVEGALEEIASDTGDLKTTVGDSESGLVKAVDDVTATVGDSESGLVKDVADLQTTVGDDTAGLVKDVADNQATMIERTGGTLTPVFHYNSATGEFREQLRDFIKTNLPGSTHGFVIVYFDVNFTAQSMVFAKDTSWQVFYAQDNSSLGWTFQIFYPYGPAQINVAILRIADNSPSGSVYTDNLYFNKGDFAQLAGKSYDYIDNWDDWIEWLAGGNTASPTWKDLYITMLDHCPIKGEDSTETYTGMLVGHFYSSGGPYSFVGTLYGLDHGYGGNPSGVNLNVTIEGGWWDGGDLSDYHVTVTTIAPVKVFTFTTYPTAKRLTIRNAPRCLKLWGDIAHNPGMDIISVAGSGSAKYLHIAGSNIVTAISGNTSSLVIDCAVSTGAVNQLILEGLNMAVGGITVTDL